jgi:hypothetical protein
VFHFDQNNKKFISCMFKYVNTCDFKKNLIIILSDSPFLQQLKISIKFSQSGFKNIMKSFFLFNWWNIIQIMKNLTHFSLLKRQTTNYLLSHFMKTFSGLLREIVTYFLLLRWQVVWEVLVSIIYHLEMSFRFFNHIWYTLKLKKLINFSMFFIGVRHENLWQQTKIVFMLFDCLKNKTLMN